MAPTYRTSAPFNSGSFAGTSHDVTLPTGIEPDDRIFMVCGNRGIQQYPDTPSGWVRHAAYPVAGSIGRDLSVFSKQADGTEDGATLTLTFTTPGTATEIQGGFAVYSGVDHNQPMSVTPTLADYNSTPALQQDAPSITPAHNNTTLMHVFVGPAAAVWTSAPTGTTERVHAVATANPRDTMAVDRAGPAAGVASGVTTAPLSASGGATTATLAIKAAPVIETERPTGTSGSVGFTAGSVSTIDQDPNDATITDTGFTAPDPSGTSTTHAQQFADSLAAVTGFNATSWTSSANATDTSDATAATFATTAAGNYGSYFQFSAAKFSAIPSTATITDIQVRARMGTSNANRINAWLQLGTANGTLVGNEGQTDGGTAMPTTVQDYGANLATPLGYVPTRAQLVSGTFGVRLRFARAASQNATLSFYAMKVTVTYTLPGSSTTTQLDVDFDNPVNNLDTGTDTGEINVLLRKNGNGADPSAALQLSNAARTWTQNLTFVSSGTTSETISSTSWTLYTLRFNQSVVTDKNDVRVRFTGTPTAGALVELGPIEWNAQVIVAPPTVTQKNTAAAFALGGLTVGPALRGRKQTLVGVSLGGLTASGAPNLGKAMTAQAALGGLTASAPTNVRKRTATSAGLGGLTVTPALRRLARMASNVSMGGIAISPGLRKRVHSVASAALGGLTSSGGTVLRKRTSGNSSLGGLTVSGLLETIIPPEQLQTAANFSLGGLTVGAGLKKLSRVASSLGFGGLTVGSTIFKKSRTAANVGLGGQTITATEYVRKRTQASVTFGGMTGSAATVVRKRSQANAALGGQTTSATARKKMMTAADVGLGGFNLAIGNNPPEQRATAADVPLGGLSVVGQLVKRVRTAASSNLGGMTGTASMGQRKRTAASANLGGMAATAIPLRRALSGALFTEGGLTANGAVILRKRMVADATLGGLFAQVEPEWQEIIVQEVLRAFTGHEVDQIAQMGVERILRVETGVELSDEEIRVQMGAELVLAYLMGVEP